MSKGKNRNNNRQGGNDYGWGWQRKSGHHNYYTEQRRFRGNVRERKFQKFVDIDNRSENYAPRSGEAGIHRCDRRNPDLFSNPVRDINIEQCDSNMVKETHQESVKKCTPQEQSDKDTNVPTNTTMSTNPSNSFSKDLPIRIKKEDNKNVKQENRSSSSGESSSIGESDPKLESSSNPPLPLNIKLKPKANSVTPTQINASIKLKTLQHSSSSSDEESETTSSSNASSKTADKPKTDTATNDSNIQSSKNKHGFEDDIVCIGKLENKIVLEDETGSNSDNDQNCNVLEREESSKKPVEKGQHKKFVKSTLRKSETCMICDKVGHTSFQCQMICKNCSAPYHGYRTCPQPANLHTMLQIFMEFCLQQFQNFSAQTTVTSFCNSFPNPQIFTTDSASVKNQINKLKRKKEKTSKPHIKTKSSKKRKTSTSKKSKFKTDSEDSSNDENNVEETVTETSAKSEDSSNSSAESGVSSKKKRKLKNRKPLKVNPNLSNFSSNPINLPIVLNGFPNLTVPAPSIQSHNTPTNALNTLLLTQMLQNAMGSLRQ